MAKLLAVLALVSGCSVALQSKPQHVGGTVAAGCTTGSGYWIADAALTGVSLVASGAGFAISAKEGEHETMGQVMAYAGLLSGLLYYASMDNGRKWARECAVEPAPIAAR